MRISALAELLASKLTKDELTEVILCLHHDYVNCFRNELVMVRQKNSKELLNEGLSKQ